MKGFSFLRRRRWRCSWWPAAARGRRTRRNIGAPRPGTLVQWANCQPAHPDACPPAPNAGCSRSRWTTPSPMASSPMDLWWRTHWRVSFSRIFPVARAGDAFHPSPRVLGDRRQAIPCEGWRSLQRRRCARFATQLRLSSKRARFGQVAMRSPPRGSWTSTVVYAVCNVAGHHGKSR